MDELHHKILTMASEANMIVNENEGSRLQILRVDWDEGVIHVADDMDEYTLHAGEVDLTYDVFYRMVRMDPDYY
jgi:hypothetical protein